MQKSIRQTLTLSVLLLTLAALAWFAVACGNDDAQEEAQVAPDTEATIQAAVAAAVATRQAEAPPEPEPTATTEPTATPEPSPTATAVVVPTSTPTPPTPEPTNGGEPVNTSATGTLSPLPVHDAEAFLAEVSPEERACLTENIAPDRMALLMATPEQATEEERQTTLGCLENDTALRLLLTPILSATGPLSPESSMCMQDTYSDTDPAELMANVMVEPESDADAQAAMAQGMVMLMVSLSCLNEPEFQSASVQMGIAPGEYEAFQCVLEAVGGQDAMAALLSPASEFPAELFQAAFACQLQMGGPPPAP